VGIRFVIQLFVRLRQRQQCRLWIRHRDGGCVLPHRLQQVIAAADGIQLRNAVGQVFAVDGLLIGRYMQNDTL
jgi:hypothetical protein